jgi:hypothetical protein
MRHGEDYVKVVGDEKFSFARIEPLLARLGLALRTMAVAAGVIRDGLVTAP